MEYKNKSEIAKMIEDFRLAGGHNKKKFAEKLGMTAESYRHLANGKTYPSYNCMQKLINLSFNTDKLFY